MTGFSLEIQSPEIAEAISNLAKANILLAESISRLAAGGRPEENAGGSEAVRAHPVPEGNDFPSRTAAAVLPVKGPPAPAAGAYFVSPESRSGAGNPYLPAPAVPALRELTGYSLTLDDLARAASSLMSTGKYLLLVELLGKFGVQALFQLPREHFGAFAAALRQLGAQI